MLKTFPMFDVVYQVSLLFSLTNTGLKWGFQSFKCLGFLWQKKQKCINTKSCWCNLRCNLSFWPSMGSLTTVPYFIHLWKTGSCRGLLGSQSLKANAYWKELRSWFFYSRLREKQLRSCWQGHCILKNNKMSWYVYPTAAQLLYI